MSFQVEIGFLGGSVLFQVGFCTLCDCLTRQVSKGKPLYLKILEKLKLHLGQIAARKKVSPEEGNLPYIDKHKSFVNHKATEKTQGVQNK